MEIRKDVKEKEEKRIGMRRRGRGKGTVTWQEQRAKTVIAALSSPSADTCVAHARLPVHVHATHARPPPLKLVFHPPSNATTKHQGTAHSPNHRPLPRPALRPSSDAGHERRPHALPVPARLERRRRRSVSGFGLVEGGGDEGGEREGGVL
jgi:hypothetical protein